MKLVIHQFLPWRVVFCFFSANFLCRPREPVRRTLVFCEQTDIPNVVLFPIQVPTTNFFDMSVPQETSEWGCPCKFRSRSGTGSSTFVHGFGHLCRGRRLHTSGDCNFGILNQNVLQLYLGTRTASAACPSQPSNLATTFITFAAVIWDADDLCSVKTALAPESFFTMSPRRLCCYTVVNLAPTPHS